MATKELRTTINNREVFARQWAALTSFNNVGKLLNVCADLALPFIEGKATFDDVLRLLAGVDHNRLMPLVKEFISCARTTDPQGNPVEISEATIDSLFSGSTIDMVLIFKAVCELQYKDFFEQGRALLPNQAQK